MKCTGLFEQYREMPMLMPVYVSPYQTATSSPAHKQQQQQDMELSGHLGGHSDIEDEDEEPGQVEISKQPSRPTLKPTGSYCRTSSKGPYHAGSSPSSVTPPYKLGRLHA